MQAVCQRCVDAAAVVAGLEFVVPVLFVCSSRLCWRGRSAYLCWQG